MSIEVITEKDRLYREHMQKQYDEEQKREQERRDRLKELRTIREEKIAVRSKHRTETDRAGFYKSIAKEKGYLSVPISEVLSTLKQRKAEIADKTLEIDTLTDRIYQEYLKECSGNEYLAEMRTRAVFMGGGCPEKYLETRELYEKLDVELLELQKDAGAFEYCKNEYIKANEDLINAEREKARRETLLSSGILEEMGIVTAKQETEESTPQEENFSSAIHNIVNGEG